jgi:hypothetical protein
MVAVHVVDWRFQAGKGFGRQPVGIRVGVGDNIAGMNDKIRPFRQPVNYFNHSSGTGQGSVTVAAVFGRGADMGITDMDKIERGLGHKQQYPQKEGISELEIPSRITKELPD